MLLGSHPCWKSLNWFAGWRLAANSHAQLLAGVSQIILFSEADFSVLHGQICWSIQYSSNLLELVNSSSIDLSLLRIFSYGTSSDCDSCNVWPASVASVLIFIHGLLRSQNFSQSIFHYWLCFSFQAHFFHSDWSPSCLCGSLPKRNGKKS